MRTIEREKNTGQAIVRSLYALPLLSLPLLVQSQPPDVEMVFVQGGSFTMGCTSEQGNYCNSDEKPVHQVTVSDFYIGRYEVTQVEWEAVMGNQPSYFHTLNWEDVAAYIRRINERGAAYAIPTHAEWAKAVRPVEGVSWNDVQEFIRRLNGMTGMSYRLPTEAEWEYAARGGSVGNSYRCSGSNAPCEVAWYGYNSGGRTHPVGTKKPNELGIHDMSGNVWEWCSDRYGAYDHRPQVNPQGALFGFSRVFRGGGWNGVVQHVSVRASGAPGECRSSLGFRLACDSTQGDIVPQDFVK
jgi:formylglycine-generating enzyme required for sulfatase activity